MMVVPGQAEGNDSEILIRPRALYRCPFRNITDVDSYLVMCDTYNRDGT